MHMPAFINELKTSDWIQIVGILATFWLGVRTIRLTKTIANRQFDFEKKKVEINRHEERMELIFKFFDVVTTATAHGTSGKARDIDIILKETNELSQIY